MSAAEWVRMPRYAIRERTWNHTVSAMQGMSSTSMMRPVGQSIATIEAAVRTIERLEPMRIGTPNSRSSRRASMSEVWRETIRPEV